MASNVFPMLSSSPPPIDDDCPDEDDEDEEFGTFASANIPFDSSFDSPVSGDKFKSFKSGDNGVNDINLKNDLNKFHSYSNSNSETPSPQDFVHTFPQQNQSNDIGFSLNEKNDAKFPSDFNSFDSSKRCSEDDVKEDKLVASHNSVPEVQSSPSHSEDISGAHEDNLSKSSNLSNCSIQRDLLKNNSLKRVGSDASRDEHHFPSAKSTESETCINSEEDSMLYSDSYSPQNINGDVLKFEESFCDVTPQNSDNACKNIDDAQTVITAASDFTAENFSSDIPSNIGFNDSPEFDDFQQAGLGLNCSSENKDPSDVAINFPQSKLPGQNVTSNQNSEIFQPNFDDLPLEENHSASDENDFLDFQSSVKPTWDYDAGSNIQGDVPECGDFHNFQDFGSGKQESDDFADFQDFNKISSSTSDEFADFEAVPFESSKPLELSESCEFADFEGAAFSSVPETTPSSSFCASSAPQEKSLDKISTVINAIFPHSEEHSNIDIPEESSAEILEQSNKSRRLWEKLHEVEQTPGLRFQWGVSHSFQQLLRSVNVDYHSILRTSSVPIFASSLSLLEPVKGHSNSANQESEDRNQSPRDPIPPVEFDWNSSGLVNPLDSGQVASTLMDLSFLSSTETNASVATGDHSFENELLKPSPIPSCSESGGKTQILEQLLSKNVSSLPNSKVTHRPSNLSEEAIHVLDQLPDLSFMQAKVLMFPISNKT